MVSLYVLSMFSVIGVEQVRRVLGKRTVSMATPPISSPLLNHLMNAYLVHRLAFFNFLDARFRTTFGLPTPHQTTGALPITPGAPPMPPPDRSIRTRTIGRFALGSDT